MHRPDYLERPSPVGPALITGATGFIGRRLTMSLLQAGCDVTALVLPDDASHLPEGVRVCTGDVTDSSALIEALAMCYENAQGAASVSDTEAGSTANAVTLYHLAAIGMSNPGLSMQAACRVNVEGVINVLDAVRGTGADNSATGANKAYVRRVVLVGSSYEYGARRSDDELDPFNPYSASKAAAWAFARAAYNAWQLPVVWVRPFQVYGPGQLSKSLVPAAVLAALRGEDFRMTEGEQQRDFVFVDDVVEGLIAAGNAADIEGRVLDLGTGQLRRVRDVVMQIWALTESKGHVLPGALPYRPGEVSAIPANVRRTRLLTGWESKTSLEAGLQATIDALRSSLNEASLTLRLTLQGSVGTPPAVSPEADPVATSAPTMRGSDQAKDLGGADRRLEDDHGA